MNTFGIGSTSAAACGELLPSYYAVTIDPDSGAITATAKCPYNFFCPGGAPSAAFNPAQLSALTGTTVEACPYGSWTQQEGASSDKERSAVSYGPGVGSALRFCRKLIPTCICPGVACSQFGIKNDCI